MNRYDNKEIQVLSKLQGNLRNKIESTTSKELRLKWKKERNKIMNNIKSKVHHLEEEKMNKELLELEKYKEDNIRYYQIMRNLNNKKTKKPIIVHNKKGKIIGSEKEQVEATSEHFKNVFSKETDILEDLPNITPEQMTPPFNAEEVYKASNKLKNNKSPGPDNVHAELIKYAPIEISQQIAKIYNITAETGENIDMIKKGILHPIAKPMKKKGPISNLRPITLLSVLRKILALIMIERCWNKMKDVIPKSQAAYQVGRSTTEQVFALKILAEKAIINENYEIFFILLDMPKAFDTVNRGKLLSMLADFLTNSELHIMKVLIMDITLNVKVGNTVGNDIKTEIGIAQGDCLSALLFIVYLALALKELPTLISKEDYEKPMWSELDWLIPRDNHKIEVDPKYADDLTFIRSDKTKINQIKRTIPKALEEFDLKLNLDKTEEYQITDKNEVEWKDCKLLGSKLDTITDINRRKGLAIDTYKTLEHIFNSSKISNSIKIRTFQTYVTSVFL